MAGPGPDETAPPRTLRELATHARRLRRQALVLGVALACADFVWLVTFARFIHHRTPGMLVTFACVLGVLGFGAILWLCLRRDLARTVAAIRRPR